MIKIKHISSVASQLAGFVFNVNNDIDELNKLIDAYNDDPNDKPVEKLKAIFNYKRLMENKYSENHISICPEFLNELEQKLFVALKEEFAKNGITDLYGIADRTAPPIANTLSTLLANMDPKQVNKLIKILSKGATYSRYELSKLYAPNGNAEFDTFLKNNDVSFLGGGNSKNFKVTPNDGSPPYVLKIEFRMGMPKLPAVHLKEGALKETILPVMAERMGTITAGVGTLSRTILTTEFSVNGDVNAHSIKHGFDNTARTDAALNVYGQMVDILIAIQEAGCAFPDMKNSNWLIKNGKLVLADTKAFIFCEKGIIDYKKTIDATGGAFVQSKFYNPPEFYTGLVHGHTISADKMHAFMLGKNLYQYLTQCNDYDFDGQNDASSMSFNYTIFETDKGKQLKELIGQLVRSNPQDRISLAEAKIKLNSIIGPQEQSKAVHDAHTGTLRKNKANDSTIDVGTAVNSHKKFKESLETIRGEQALDHVNSKLKSP